MQTATEHNQGLNSITSPQPPIKIGKLLFYMFWIFSFLLLSFSDWLGLVPIPVAGIRFYGADAIVFFLLLCALVYGVISLFRTRLSLAFLFFILFGLVSLLVGVLADHQMNKIIGDFRRMFFYSVAFIVSWALLNTPDRTTRFSRIIRIAALPVIFFSILRVWQGVSFSSIYTEGDPRAVAYTTTTVLFWVYYDAITRLMTPGRKAGKLADIIWLLLMVAMFLISNFRSLWLIPVMGVVGIIFLMAPRGRRTIFRILGLILILCVIIGAAVASLRLLQPDLYTLVEQKFYQEFLGFQFQDSFRYFVWGEALSRFQTSPVLGVGLGDVLIYDILSSQGTWYTRTSTTHNILVEFLYQTGVAGLIVYLIPHILFNIYILTNLFRIPKTWQQQALAAYFTYLSMLMFGMIQPFLTDPGVAVLHYLIMGVTARDVYWGRRDHSAEEDLQLENRYV